MTTKQLIAAGIDGGYDSEQLGYFVNSHNKIIHVYEQYLGGLLLDPEFWQAVGKAEDKHWVSDCCKKEINYCEKPPHNYFKCTFCFKECFRDEWCKVKMHQMINALAEGKSISEFIKTL